MGEPFSLTEEEKFWSLVDRRGPTECWPWKGNVHWTGYGRFFARGKQFQAHRYAWEISNFPAPPDLLACHTCDNRPCCNPAHVFLDTQTGNIEDAASKGRMKGASQPGERNPNARLVERDVQVIRYLYSTGHFTQQELADQYGVTENTVQHIVKRRTWKFVEQPSNLQLCNRRIGA